jgi:hypothetical protein
MSNRNEHKITLASSPVEIKLADVLFFAMRRNMMLFKDLDKKHIHYSLFIYDSIIDFHETLEVNGRHVQLAKVEFDWRFLLNGVIEKIRADWKSIFQNVKTDDPEWQDLEIEFIPVQVLMELLPPLMKGARWNIDVAFLEKLEKSLGRSKVGDLADYGMIIGIGSGYLVFVSGSDCFLFDTIKMSKIIEKSFELSIRKIDLKYYTLGSTVWCAKIRLRNLLNSIVKHISSSPQNK